MFTFPFSSINLGAQKSFCFQYFRLCATQKSTSSSCVYNENIIHIFNNNNLMYRNSCVYISELVEHETSQENKIRRESKFSGEFLYYKKLDKAWKSFNIVGSQIKFYSKREKAICRDDYGKTARIWMERNEETLHIQFERTSWTSHTWHELNIKYSFFEYFIHRRMTVSVSYAHTDDISSRGGELKCDALSWSSTIKYSTKYLIKIKKIILKESLICSFELSAKEFR